MQCLPLVSKGRGAKDSIEALNALVTYYRKNFNRMLRLPHRQRRGGERPSARPADPYEARGSALGAEERAKDGLALRTSGALRVYDAIRKAHWDTHPALPSPPAPAQTLPLCASRPPRRGARRSGLKLISQPAWTNRYT